MRNLVARFVSAGGVIYLGSIFIYFLLRWTWPIPIWWLNFVDAFAPYLLALALPLLIVGLLLRTRFILTLCVFPIVLFAFLYGELFFLKSASVPDTATTLTVMTFNALATNHDYRSVADMIAAEAPDIVALQELTPEMAEYLATAFADRYPYRDLAARRDFSGAGVFSRFPIREEERFQVNGRGHISQRLLIEIRGQGLQLFNLHPHPPGLSPIRAGWQEEQIEEDLRRIAQIEGPIIVAGDFNLTDQTRNYRQIIRYVKDTYREAGWGFGHTFPAGGRFYGLPLPFPIFRIDYIFHSPDLVALEAHLGANAGSDHNPVIARLGLK